MPTTDKYLDQAIMQRLSYIVQTLFKKEQILSAYSADLRMDDNFVLTFSLYNREGEAILNKSIDLPLEDMIIDGWYDEETKKIVLVLKSGTRIEFSVADLVSGLQSEITPENKLNSDLVSDVNQVHKFTTFADIQKLAGIEPGAQVNLPPVETEDDKLKVHKIDKAEPLITIEGVDYYHKYEFDLENLNENLGVEGVSCVNLLTGEIYNDDDNTAYISTHTNGGNTKGLKLYLAKSSPFNIDIYKGTLYDNVTYTSCAFTVVQTRNQVNNINKICLPGCTNYYGWLSEDGNTFISYWNEEADLLINPITKITDGINTIDIHDSRLPNAGTEGKFLKDDFTWDTVDALPDRTSAQANDVLKLDNNKEPIWDSISVGGLQVVELNSSSGTLTDEQYTLLTSDNAVIKFDNIYYYKYLHSGIQLFYNSIDVRNNNHTFGQDYFYIGVDRTHSSYKTYGKSRTEFNQVYANPPLSGSESDLTSLQIGENKYKINSSLPADLLLIEGELNGKRIEINESQYQALIKGKVYIHATDLGYYYYFAGNPTRYYSNNNWFSSDGNSFTYIVPIANITSTYISGSHEFRNALIYANKALSGNEPDLTSLQVGSTIFKVPTGDVTKLDLGTLVSNNIYSSANTYNIDDIVYYDGLLYKCISPVTVPGDFNPNKWQQITIESLIELSKRELYLDTALFALSTQQLTNLYSQYMIELASVSLNLPANFFERVNCSAFIGFDNELKRIEFIANNSSEKVATTYTVYNNQRFKVDICIYMEEEAGIQITKCLVTSFPLPFQVGTYYTTQQSLDLIHIQEGNEGE